MRKDAFPEGKNSEEGKKGYTTVLKNRSEIKLHEVSPQKWLGASCKISANHERVM